MTTPRVTVPVEPTEAMINHAVGHIGGGSTFDTDDRREIAQSVYRAMLSAAPAPEGGADHISTSGEMVGPQSFPLHGENDLLNHSLKAVRVLRTMMAARRLDAGVKVSDGLIADLEVALVTREEAPAEAGDAIDRLTRQVASASPDHKTMFVYVADLRAALVALRAQLPAREDAQPVAWRVGDDGAVYTTLKAAKAHVDGWRRQGMTCCDPQPLYTHPARDALRVAVEALEKIADARVFDERGEDYRGIAHPYRACRADETEQVAIKALAVLQAEQKGGA